MLDLQRNWMPPRRRECPPHAWDVDEGEATLSWLAAEMMVATMSVLRTIPPVVVGHKGVVGDECGIWDTSRCCRMTLQAGKSIVVVKVGAP